MSNVKIQSFLGIKISQANYSANIANYLILKSL